MQKGNCKEMRQISGHGKNSLTLFETVYTYNNTSLYLYKLRRPQLLAYEIFHIQHKDANVRFLKFSSFPSS